MILDAKKGAVNTILYDEQLVEIPVFHHCFYQSFSLDALMFHSGVVSTMAPLRSRSLIVTALTAIEYNWVCGPTAYLASLFAQLQFLWTEACFYYWIDYWNFKFDIIRFCNTMAVVFTYTSELLLPEQRMPMRAFFNWELLDLCLQYLPALLLVILVFPESPTFLHSVGKLEQMRANEKRIAWIGGVKYQEMEYECVVEQQSFFTLLKNKSLCQRVLVLWTMWFTAAICAYATDLNSSTISGNLFLNQAFFAIILIISKFFLIPFDAFSFSRRNLHQYSQLAAIICFVLLTCLLLIDKQGLVILIVNTLGMVFIQYTWDAGRNRGVLAPTLAFLNTFWAPSVYLTVTIHTLQMSVDKEILEIQNVIKSVQKTIVKLSKEVSNISGRIDTPLDEFNEAVHNVSMDVNQISKAVSHVINKFPQQYTYIGALLAVNILMWILIIFLIYKIVGTVKRYYTRSPGNYYHAVKTTSS
uniref:Gustatory receptor n=1 Tax=Ditylenchus dipsaci TaxID=166011 RepID=A0A915EQS6_9BILA